MTEPYDTINSLIGAPFTSPGPRSWFRFSSESDGVPDEGQLPLVLGLLEVISRGSFNGDYEFEVNPAGDGFGILFNGAGGLGQTSGNDFFNVANSQTQTVIFVFRLTADAGPTPFQSGAYIGFDEDYISYNSTAAGNAVVLTQNNQTQNKSHRDITSPTKFADLEPHSLTWITDALGSGSPSMYIDGIAVSIVSAGPGTIPDNLSITDDLLPAFGFRGRVNNVNAIGQVMYEWMVYNGALTAADVLTAHNILFGLEATTGTVVAGATEAEIVAGGQTIVMTLDNDTWVDAGALFDAQRQAIIDGITSAQSEAGGWNNEVRDELDVNAVIRTSATVVTITLDPAPDYSISADEIITVTSPATALTLSTVDVIFTPTFTIVAAAVVGVVSGTIVDEAVDEEIVAGGQTIILTVIEDTWLSVGASFDAQRQNILDGITSAQSETTGWNAEVRDKEDVSAVVRTSDTVVTITLSPAPDYLITGDETITTTVPATALVFTTSDLIFNPTFTIKFLEFHRTGITSASNTLIVADSEADT